MPSPDASFRFVLGELEDASLLLLSDPLLPSVAVLVAGERVKGSWWGHKKGHEIFRVLKRLESNPDVMTTKLVSGKVTFLHRRLWNDFFAVCTSREDWQTKHLSADARKLLSHIEKRRELRTDRVPEPLRGAVDFRKAVGELETKLLVHGDELHTEKGAHAKVLKPWSRWARETGFRPGRSNVAKAKKGFEKLLDDLNTKYSAKGRLPWLPAGKTLKRVTRIPAVSTRNAAPATPPPP